MSLILEALRKSEVERRRGERPGLHGQLPPIVPSPRNPIPPAVRWMVVLIAALGLGWSVYGWLTRTSPPKAPPLSPVAARMHTEPAPTTSLPPVRHLTPPPAVPRPRPAIREAPPPSAPSSEALRRAPPARSLPVPIPAPAATPNAVDIGRTMHLSDLDPEQRKALPPLKLSMHMWNDDPAQRFVILDGNRLREGDRLGDAVVTAITRDGAVLDWEGRRLLVPIR